ncbi:unnamed protein product [Somion occarium]|uniref:GTP 3',8-cyclase n=1 Tax=Somion occarium TaxID=3059160 RepID=A0ABP1CIN4_9APHY
MVTKNFGMNTFVRSSRGLRTLPTAMQAQAVEAVRQQAKDRISQIDTERPVSPFLIDTFARRHDYLRISLTERCNLRCFYCMPSEGVELSPNENILTDEEVIRLATLFVRNGVTKIRLTGGEPTVRKNIVDIVGRLNELRQLGLRSIGMTTNGIALRRRLPSLVANGLTHLNISIDTLDPFKFEIMTRRPGHEAVLRSIEMALSIPELHSLKLNIVVVKGLNDTEVLDFIDMTRDKRLSVRFIEFMPFTGNKWDKAKMVPSSELLSRIASRHPKVTRASDALNDTARNYFIPGYNGSFGFISSMSDHFCGSCNRLRLTADGQIKVCLFDAKEISLRDQMRQGASDEELLQTVGYAVRGKNEKHAGMEDIDVVTNRPMILIGGASMKSLNKKKRSSLSYLNSRPHQPHRNTTTGPRPFSTCSTARSDATRDRLTHIDDTGRPAMVTKSAYDLVTSAEALPDTSDTNVTKTATQKAVDKARSKGNVLTVAQLAAIMGCKRTSDLIPLCHPLPLSHISVSLSLDGPRSVERSRGLEEFTTSGPDVRHASELNDRPPFSIVCQATVSCEGKTGVEMEALTAVSVGLLTVWDMLKAIAGREMVIGDIVVQRKEGGKSEDFVRN